MTTVDLHEAKMTPSRLVDRVAAGEEITIVRAGRPNARLVPLAKRHGPRRLGLFRNEIPVGEDFDAPLPQDIQDGFDCSEP